MNFDFGHYYLYDEVVGFLHKMEARYPDLVSLYTIGKSYEGRSLYVVALTNQETGVDQEKPAYWIDGNTHAAEVTGSAACLYTLEYLLSNYKKVSKIRRLLDGYTVYVMPRLAVDGAEKYLTTPEWLRSSPRAYPQKADRKGLTPEDINGDGLILQMRIKDPVGAWKASSVDSRIMLRREPDEFEGTFYTLLVEGKVVDYDGFNILPAPVASGVDFNRNYPGRWAPESVQPGAGEFPLSEPEIRAEVAFWQTHPNINGFYTYHTYGGILLRPYNTYPDEHFPPEDLEVYQLLGKKAEQLTDYTCVSIYHEFSDLYRDKLFGVMDDYGYDQYGWFGFTPELWDAPKAAGVERIVSVENYAHDPWLPEADSLKLMVWNDSALAGNGFVKWQPFDHPQLGLVEIGGWKTKQVWENAPPQYLPEICDQHCQFTIFHALLSPRLAIAQVAVSTVHAGVYRLVVQLENQGFLPTYTSQKARQRQAVQPIQVLLDLPEQAALVAGDNPAIVGHLTGRATKTSSDTGAFDFRCTADWVITAPTQTRIRIRAFSERAGIAETTALLQPD